MIRHFSCADGAQLNELARVIGPHFIGDSDDSGRAVGAVECQTAAHTAYLRGLPGVVVFPQPSRHTESLSDEHVALLSMHYGVKAGDTMRDALEKIQKRHPTFWFDSENF